MDQRHDFEQQPPTFFGAGFTVNRDQIRLTKSLQSVYNVLKDEHWHTLESISQAIRKPEASVSAHIRTLRRPEHGGYCIERRHIKDGLHEYRLDHAKPTNWEPKKKKIPVLVKPEDDTIIAELADALRFYARRGEDKGLWADTVLRRHEERLKKAGHKWEQ